MLSVPSYKFYTNRSKFEFEFNSTGIKGVIAKVARFDEMDENVYNFSFGDLDKETGDISDSVVSNNGDRDMVLATVGQIVYYFSGVFSNALIFIQGGNAARTRLYQQALNKYWNEISVLFEIWGRTDDDWQRFEKGKNYNAFLGRRKFSV
jgi:hypothetical protein